MGWKRGPATTDATKAAQRKRGRTYIPTRQEMNELNEPKRDAAWAKANPAKARKKKR